MKWRFTAVALPLGIAASLLALASSVTPAVATEGTATEVDVTLTFGGGCAGQGSIQIDGGGRLIGGPHDPQWGEAVHDTLASWDTGTRIRVQTTFAGPAAPRLRLVDAAGRLLLELGLTPWGRPLPPGGDRIVISCSGGTYAIPDTALVLTARPSVPSIGWWLLALAVALAPVARRRSPLTSGARGK